jgi:hypothetical protein
MANQAVHKDDVLESIGPSRSSIQKYRDFFVGEPGLWALIKYELGQGFASHVPGAAGYVLRKMFVLPLLQHAGTDVKIGRGVGIRHPGKIVIGDRSAVDDLCMLDARGVMLHRARTPDAERVYREHRWKAADRMPKPAMVLGAQRSARLHHVLAPELQPGASTQRPWLPGAAHLLVNVDAATYF